MFQLEPRGSLCIDNSDVYTEFNERSFLWHNNWVIEMYVRWKKKSSRVHFSSEAFKNQDFYEFCIISI